jgi:enoyl-CoA hydratase
MSELIGYEIRDSTAYLTLQRVAKQNALTAAMVEEILERLALAVADDNVKAVVINGEGPAFCAGFDITDPSAFQGSEAETLRSRLRSIEEKSDWMRQMLLLAKPLIVSVHGACIGIGTYIALMADFAVVAEDAFFGLPEERFGSAGATWAYPFLIREVGIKRANEIVMTGRRFTAAEFHDMGLINRVVARENLAGTTESLCEALGSLPREGIALNRTVKSMALSTIGHLSVFPFHAAVHPQGERLEREADEFDFMAIVAKDGLKHAIAERERRFGGEWWGW